MKKTLLTLITLSTALVSLHANPTKLTITNPNATHLSDSTTDSEEVTFSAPYTDLEMGGLLPQGQSQRQYPKHLRTTIILGLGIAGVAVAEGVSIYCILNDECTKETKAVGESLFATGILASFGASLWNVADQLLHKNK